MADVMNGAERVHWLAFKIAVDDEFPITVNVSVWRRDNENTDDYADIHPAMLKRATASLRERFGSDATINYVEERNCYE
jgi:hypothetical protein